MEENISSMLGALIWIIIAPFMIWNPEKCMTSIGKIYQKFGRHVSPFHKDENFEFRPLTAILTSIIAVILLVISLVGFYLNLMGKREAGQACKHAKMTHNMLISLNMCFRV